MYYVMYANYPSGEFFHCESPANRFLGASNLNTAWDIAYDLAKSATTGAGGGYIHLAERAIHVLNIRRYAVIDKDRSLQPLDRKEEYDGLHGGSIGNFYKALYVFGKWTPPGRVPDGWTQPPARSEIHWLLEIIGDRDPSSHQAHNCPVY